MGGCDPNGATQRRRLCKQCVIAEVELIGVGTQGIKKSDLIKDKLRPSKCPTCLRSEPALPLGWTKAEDSNGTYYIDPSHPTGKKIYKRPAEPEEGSCEKCYGQWLEWSEHRAPST